MVGVSAEQVAHITSKPQEGGKRPTSYPDLPLAKFFSFEIQNKLVDRQLVWAKHPTQFEFSQKSLAVSQFFWPISQTKLAASQLSFGFQLEHRADNNWPPKLVVSQVSDGNHPFWTILNVFEHEASVHWGPSSGPYQCLSHLPLVLQTSLVLQRFSNESPKSLEQVQ